MPKQRRNSSNANRSDEQTPIELELARRLNLRLENAGEVVVNVDSRSRGITEEISVRFAAEGGAVVRSGSGNEYIVNGEECTCPDHLQRGRARCRHIEAVDIARQQASAGFMSSSETAETLNVRDVMAEQIRNENIAEINALQQNWTDDDFFYTENPNVYNADLEKFKDTPVPYYYENVLNGSNVTFGIELEFVDGNSDAIARDLHLLGLCSHNTMQRYHGQRSADKWILEVDSSVTSGRRGGELISPILRDTPETWQQIELICAVAKRHGARVNQKTGGHIHVDAKDLLDGKKQRWRRFFKLAVGAEAVYMRLAGGEQGKFREGGYAPSSLSQNFRGVTAALPNDGETSLFQQRINRIGGGKYESINVNSFGSSKGTVEFRAFNGTLSPAIIQANIKYAVGFINTSMRSRTRSSDGITATDSDKKRGQFINDYVNNNAKDDNAIMRTLDMVFSRKEDKEHVLSVIAKNSWASASVETPQMRTERQRQEQREVTLF